MKKSFWSLLLHKGFTIERNNGALYFTASSHSHTRKIFILMLGPGGVQLLIIGTCFAWHPATSINKCRGSVLTARAHVNCLIDTRLLISCETGIYAIDAIITLIRQDIRTKEIMAHYIL